MIRLCLIHYSRCILFVFVTIAYTQLTVEEATAKFPTKPVHCPFQVVNCSCSAKNVNEVSVKCMKLKYREVPSGLGNHIIQLNLDGNFIERLSARFLSSATNLRILSIQNNNIKNISGKAFIGLSHLEKLDLSGNWIGTLPDSVFTPLFSLLELNLSNASLRTVPFQAFGNQPMLRHLYLGSNKLVSFPLFLNNRNISVLPNLTYLQLNHNQIPFIPFERLNNFPKLTDLYLDYNIIRELKDDAFALLPRLKKLSLARNDLQNQKSVHPFAFRSKSLTDINVQTSHLHLSAKQCRYFQYTPALESLTMAESKIEPNTEPAFQNLPHLGTLDISKTTFVPNAKAFENSTNIVFLNMNEIMLPAVNASMFQNLSRLTRLHLSKNLIEVINYTSFPNKLWDRLTEIDLSLNPFICDCGIVWFRKWLRGIRNHHNIFNVSTVVVNLAKPAAYTCSYPSVGNPILELTTPSDEECFASQHDFYLLTALLVDICIGLVSIIASMIHRFRWHIRYFRFVVKIRNRRYKDMIEQREYTYDAFVIYSQEDSEWVIHNMRPRVEIEDDLRLCIHHRDWLGGRDITDNITASIEDSRKSLLIVSNAFAASQWCHFEMMMAQSRLFQEDRDNMVLVVLEEIAECHMTPRLRLQMQRQTYIEWTDNVLGQQLFWTRLRQALRRPDESVINSPLPQSMFADQHNSIVDTPD